MTSHMGRRTLYNDKVHEALVEGVRAGLPYSVSAARAGVSEATLYAWLSQGRRLREGLTDTSEPCPTCGATGDDPCMSKSGNKVRHHSKRAISERDAFADGLATLVADIEKAEADAHARNLGLIQKAAQEGSWQAGAWYLERKYPALYGRHRVEVTGADGGPVQVDVPADQLEAKVRELLTAAGADADTG